MDILTEFFKGFDWIIFLLGLLPLVPLFGWRWWVRREEERRFEAQQKAYWAARREDGPEWDGSGG